MKSTFGLSRRFLKKQWRRTLFTCIGIALATALFTGVALIGFSMQDMIQKEFIERNGAWEYGISGVSPEEASNLAAHNRVRESQVIPYSRYYAMSSDEEGNPNPWMLMDLSSSDVDLTRQFVSLTGRLPEDENEIVLEQFGTVRDANNESVIAIGSTLSLPIVERGSGEVVGSRTWTVVGISFHFIDHVDTLMTRAYTVIPPNEQDGAFVYVNMRNGSVHVGGFLGAVNDAVSDFPYASEEDFNKHRLGEVEYEEGYSVYMHTNLLLSKGVSWDNEMTRTLILFLSVLILMIMSVVIIVIRNALSMSVHEKVEVFGLLRIVGGSPAQLRQTVLADALQMALLSIPVGVAGGVAAIHVVASVVRRVDLAMVRYLQPVVSPIPILIGAVLALVSVVFSALGPMRRAGRMSAMEAVRQSDTYRVSNRAERVARKGKVTGFLLGASGRLAMKNIRRDRRRFRTTAASVGASALLFVVVFGLTSMMEASIDTLYSEKTDFSISTLHSVIDGEDPDYATEKKWFQDLSAEISAIPDLKNTVLFREMVTGYLCFSTPDFSDEYLLDRDMDPSSSTNHLSNHHMLGIGKEALPQLGISDVDAVWEALERGEAILFQIDSRREFGGDSLYVRIPFTRYTTGDDFPLHMDPVDWGDMGEAFANDQTASFLSLKDLGFSDSIRIVREITDAPWFFQLYQDSVLLIMSDNYLTARLEGTGIEAMETFYPYYNLSIDATDGKESEVEHKLFSQYIHEDTANEDAIYQDGSFQNRDLRMRNNYRYMVDQRNSILVIKLFLYGFVTVITLISLTNILNIIYTGILLRKREFGMLQAIGMTRGQISRMLLLECSLYGATGALWGVLIGGGLFAFLMYQISNITQGFVLNFFPWSMMLITFFAAILISLAAGFFPIRSVVRGRVLDMIRTIKV